MLPGLRALAIGGTAVGTGLNAHPEFAERAARKIAELTSQPFTSHPNKFAALSAHDELVMGSGALKTLAGSLMKIANDIRWLGSGPRCGLGELALPENEPGSSIMPGKVNPVIPEAVSQAAMMVMGYDSTIAQAAAAGSLELNPFLPLIAACLLESLLLLQRSCLMLRRHCVEGIVANEAVCRRHVDSSSAAATALVPEIGYDAACEVVKAASARGVSVRAAAVDGGLVSAARFDELLSAEAVCRLGTPTPATRGSSE